MNTATHARMEIQTLTDGSKVYNVHLWAEGDVVARLCVPCIDHTHARAMLVALENGANIETLHTLYTRA